MDYEAHNYRKFDFKTSRSWQLPSAKILTVWKEHFVEDAKKIAPEGEIRIPGRLFRRCRGARDLVILDRP